MTDLHNTKGQKVICLNIRSLYANHSQLELDFANSNYAVICLTETWLHSLINTSIIDIPGFSIIRLDRSTSKKGGGVAMYVNNNLGKCDLDVSQDISNSNIELLSIKIIRHNQKPIYVSVSYLPPKSNITKALDSLDTLANYLSAEEAEWVLCGDFNVDLSVTSKSRHRKTLHNFSTRHQLRQLIHLPTRVTKTSSTILDHNIYTNLDPEMTHANVLKYGLSDHDITFLIIKKSSSKPKRDSFTCRDLSNYSPEMLMNIINNQDWMPFYNEDDINASWTILYNQYIDALQLIAPFRTMYNVKECKHWATPELLKVIRKRDTQKKPCRSFI